MKIGSVALAGRAVLAPLAGVNDLAFRVQCASYGSAMNWTPMVSVNAVERNNKAALRLAATAPEEPYVVLQLYGTRLSAIKHSIERLENDPSGQIAPAIFGFNFGCPKRKIMAQGAGAALLRRPKKIGDIVATMRAATDRPICAKIRLGITHESAQYLRTAKTIEENGADFIVVHARYQTQDFRGEAQWDAIAEIKRQLTIPVVGNGDVVDGPSAQRMLDRTGCDAVMVGRAAMGNPYIFRQIDEYLATGRELGHKSKEQLFIEYLELAERYNVKQTWIAKHAHFFTKHVRGARRLRDRLTVHHDDPEKLLACFRKYRAKCTEND